MREWRSGGNGRKVGSVLTLAALVLVAMGPVAAVADSDEIGHVLPFVATGILGSLDTTASALPHVVLFDTTAGIYYLDGVAMSDESQRRALDLGLRADGAPGALWAFDFGELRLGPSTTVTARGDAPLVLLVKGEASLGADFRMQGAPGHVAGKGAGGGGGGGGGALAVLSERALSLTGTISVDGGPGGVGNIWDGNPTGGAPDAAAKYRGGDGGAGMVLLASAERVLYDGAISALVGGAHVPDVSSVALVGPVAFGPAATLDGAPVAAPSARLALLSSLPYHDVFLSAGGGGAGAGGSGLPIDPSGNERRDGFATFGGAGGVGGPGGGAGGDGAFAVAGGAGGNGGDGGATASPPWSSVDGGGSGGGGGGGGAYSGPGGSGGIGGGAGTGLNARRGLDGLPGVTGGSGHCAWGDQSGGAGGVGGSSVWPASPGGPGGAGGFGGSPGSAGGDGFAGGNGRVTPPGSASANGGGGGGGGAAYGGDGADGGFGGNGHPSFGDGGGGGGGGGGGADTCSPLVPVGDGGNGGAGGSGTHGGSGGQAGGGATSGQVGGTAACSDAADNDGDGLVDYPADPGCSSASDGTEENPIPGGGGGGGWCPASFVHSYGTGGGMKSIHAPAYGSVSVIDTNTADCNGDGIPGDNDGDYDSGMGGGAFGYGPFASACGIQGAGGNYLVQDFSGLPISFVVGADDQSGGSGFCLGDGIISPSADPDDCLVGIFVSSGSAAPCTGGADGLMWIVFVAEVTVEGGSVSVGSPPTVGTILAY